MRFFQRYPYIVRILLVASLVAFTVIISGALMMRFSMHDEPVKANISPSPTNTGSFESTPIVPEKLPVVVATNPITIAQANSTPITQQPIDGKVAYGHFPYAQGDINQMMPVGSYASGKEQRLEYLNKETGLAFMKMIYAARDEGVWIVPVSGFRSIEQQTKLFEQQTRRRGSSQEAAKVSAPPGYSEHHTGYALDLTDGKSPKLDITVDFEKTDTFRWLTRRGKEFGFEISFIRNNKQGVIYEPWHWRYVGSPNASAIFASARKH
jgi:zinc D-Ala-D-Ala carboxypeptidase